ncbi:MAG: hypothetical protein CVT90_00355 [Candidatus Altiarchaeales archaeon HGW-Altiarchaeales-3]|nr:MAG: hypothetical protein CVT90_00355 [Candidatus Altiarchaeales archaeon HGW-Altiarchaeales-3]
MLRGWDALNKMVTVTAKDIMQRGESLAPNDSATKARAMIRRWGSRALPVLEGNKLVGILTRGDLIQRVTSSKTNLEVKDIMKKGVITSEPDEEIFSVAKKIIGTGARQIPVIENSEFLGIITSSSIINAFVDNDYNPVKKNIAEVMQTDVVFVSPDDKVSQVWDKMRSGGFSGFPIVEKGKVLGFISRRDIFLRGSVRLSKESGKSRMTTVSKIMRQLVAVITPDKTTKEVAKYMIDRNVIRLPIVDNEKSMKLVGIVDAEDILRAYVGV